MQTLVHLSDYACRKVKSGEVIHAYGRQRDEPPGNEMKKE